MIYTIGDSFTYGAELKDPSQDAWPSLLSKSLNKPVTNLGQPGVSNTSIIEKIIDVVYKEDSELIIIAWTSYLRTQQFDGESYDTWPGAIHCKKKLSVQMTDNLTRSYDDGYNVWAYKNWLRQIILTQTLLKHLNKKYLMAVAFHTWGNLYNSQYLWDRIDLNNFMGVLNKNDTYHENFGVWTVDTPKGLNDHPLELGHKMIAEKINEYIGNQRWRP